ncbi:hypothetical protein [Sinomonas halotolerans]|uniref:YCII-related domain-containing protein n=1 Tax=Sinomonas halotolerans TaxID=1644133 RepID=A0ABU9X3M7_9MICC
MTRFLITYHGMAYPNTEYAVASRRVLREWANRKLGDALVDFGAPLLLAGQLSDGPPFDSVEISGYTIIQASSLSEARELLADHPYLARGATLQIDECMEVDA